MLEALVVVAVAQIWAVLEERRRERTPPVLARPGEQRLLRLVGAASPLAEGDGALLGLWRHAHEGDAQREVRDAEVLLEELQERVINPVVAGGSAGLAVGGGREWVAGEGLGVYSVVDHGGTSSWSAPWGVPAPPGHLFHYLKLYPISGVKYRFFGLFMRNSPPLAVARAACEATHLDTLWHALHPAAEGGRVIPRKARKTLKPRSLQFFPQT